MPKKKTVIALGIGATVAGAAGTGYALQRGAVGRWRVSEDQLIAAGRTLPLDVRHHFVPVSDGGRIHVVEKGSGPPLLLVHGVTLGVGVWAPQFHRLAGRHRVIAIDQRGHGQSLAGDDGYRLTRLADDLFEVIEALDLSGSRVVGHSMGGMVAQLLAIRRPQELARYVDGLVLVATSAGPLVPEVLGISIPPFVTRGAGRSLLRADRKGRGLFPTEDFGVWITRVAFGNHPGSADVELTRSLTAAMSPGAMSELLDALFSFDIHDRIHEIAFPVKVVVGSRDVLTPPRMARAIARRIPGAELTIYPGSGHMVMLERVTAFCDLLHAAFVEPRGVGTDVGR